MCINEINAAIVDEIENIVYLVDADNFNLLFINNKASKFFGLNNEEQWKGKPCYKALHGFDSPCPDCPIKDGGNSGEYEWERHDKVRNVYLYKKNKKIKMDGKSRWLCVSSDITKVHKVMEQTKRQYEIEQIFVSCLRNLYETDDMELAINNLLAIIGDYHKSDRAYIFEISEDGKFMSNTYEWCREGVVPQIEYLQDMKISLLDRWMIQFNKNGAFFLDSLHGEVDKNSDEFRILDGQGIESLMAAPLRVKGKFVGFLGVDNPSANMDTMMLMQSVSSFVINDIQKRNNLAKLYKLSYNDQLTGAGNRNAYIKFMNELENVEKSVGIIYCDINGLKVVNDAYGHERGDEMIRSVAGILKSIFDEENVFRVGGDEFVVFCIDIDKYEFEYLAESLNDRWNPEYTASVGYIWLPEGCKIQERHVAHADKLMYENKRKHYK